MFNELYNMDETIESHMESLYNFRYYRYCNRIGAKEEYAATDLFSPNIQQVKALADRSFSHKFVAHLPQHRLVNLLADKLATVAGGAISYGSEVTQAVNRANQVELELYDHHDKNTRRETFDLVVACDGFHSKLRSIAGIGLSSTEHKMCFLNIYFKSKELAGALVRLKRTGMLHFVYNSKVRSRGRRLLGEPFVQGRRVRHARAPDAG